MYAYSTMPAAAIVSSRNALPLFLWWGMLYNYTKNGSVKFCLRKRPTVCDSTTGLDEKWRVWNKHRNSILMTRHYPELGSASDWLYRKGNLLQPISTLPRAEKGHVISIKFLQSFFSIRRHFTRKPLVASRNVGCFLRLRQLHMRWITFSPVYIVSTFTD